MKTGRLSQTAGVCCLVAIVLASTSITSGQVMDTLVKAKSLYAEASYDEALAVLRGSDAAEAYQYRALCFIALGRTQDAERALESLINVAPAFAVSDADLPPRLVALFSQTRRRVMPAIAKRLFTEARTDFQAKNLPAARDKFEAVLTLAHDPAMADSSDAVDLQLLVASYLDIVHNSLAPVPAAAPVHIAPAIAPVMPPPMTPALAAASPAAAPASGATAASASVPGTRTLLPAVTIRQTFPPFTVTPGQTVRPMSGAVRITIGVDGKVTSATMEVSVDPRYDSRLLAAAKSWIYRPATLGGEPIPSEKVVQINIAP